MLKQLKPQPADASRTPSKDGALLPTSHCCQLSSWHLGTLYIEAGKCHTANLVGQLCQRGSLPFQPGPQPFPASQGSSGLTASDQDQLIPRSGLSPLSPACFRPWRIWPLVSSAAVGAAQGRRVWISPSANPAQSGVGLKQHIRVGGHLCVPQDVAFPGCRETPWSCTQVRLNGKGQSSVWLLADLSVGKYLEAAFPGVARTACSLLEKSLCSLGIQNSCHQHQSFPCQLQEAATNSSLFSLRNPRRDFLTLQLPLPCPSIPCPKKSLQLSWSPFTHWKGL